MEKINRLSIKSKAIEVLKNQSILLILIGIIIIFSLTVPTFFNSRNLLNIVKQISIIGIIASGFTLVLINGDIDLSVGSLFSLTGVIVISLQQKGLFISIIVTILVAALVGFINGFISTKFNLPSIIVTLGMLSILEGSALIYTKGYNLLGDPKSLYSIISKGSIFNIPNNIIIFIVVVCIIGFILHKTVFGRNIYLIGTNSEASRIAGIKVNKVRIIAFIICSICVAISSILQSSRISSASPVAGIGFEFDAITVVLVGGTSFFGGKGSIYNTILGTLIIAILINGMILFGLPFAFQFILKGSLILLAIFIDVKARLKFGRS